MGDNSLIGSVLPKEASGNYPKPVKPSFWADSFCLNWAVKSILSQIGIVTIEIFLTGQEGGLESRRVKNKRFLPIYNIQAEDKRISWKVYKEVSDCVQNYRLWFFV